MWTDPEVLGGFLLVRRLAESAMASVHLAVRLADSSGKPLVIKRPPIGERASGRAAQAILREAEVLSEVRGAGIPALEGAGDVAGLPYVALERLRGASLAKILAAGEALSPPVVRAIGLDVGRALAKLHAAGWVHRDVTPSNVLVDDTGEVYLLDYGLCARAGDGRGAAVAGTRGYVAPEAATPVAAGPAQDVYGLAVCLAEAALGRRLFDEASLVEAAGRGDAPPQAAALEGDLPGIAAALRRDPAARPAAADLAAGLDRDLDRSALAALAMDARDRPSSAPVEARSGMELSAFGAEPVGGGAGPGGAAAARVSGSSATLLGGPLVTPTVSTPILTVRDVAGPSIVRGSAASRGSAAAPESTRRAEARASRALAALIAALLALAIGFFAGRVSTRPRGSSFAITGPLPKRAEVYLDGKKLTIADGVPLPVAPGAHTITVLGARSSRREIPFQVRGGEHVVVVYTARAGGAAAPDDDVAP